MVARKVVSLEVGVRVPSVTPIIGDAMKDLILNAHYAPTYLMDYVHRVGFPLKQYFLKSGHKAIRAPRPNRLMSKEERMNDILKDLDAKTVWESRDYTKVAIESLEASCKMMGGSWQEIKD